MFILQLGRSGLLENDKIASIYLEPYIETEELTTECILNYRWLGVLYPNIGKAIKAMKK